MIFFFIKLYNPHQLKRIILNYKITEEIKLHLYVWLSSYKKAQYKKKNNLIWWKIWWKTFLNIKIIINKNQILLVMKKNNRKIKIILKYLIK